MHRISLSLLACAAFGAIAISGAPAAIHAANIAAASVATSAASNPRDPAKHSSSTSRASPRALTRAARKARTPAKAKPAVPAPKRATANRATGKNFAAAQQAAQAEISTRSERIYRASQFSAPIIIDAKACKRIGAHGESIYENC